MWTGIELLYSLQEIRLEFPFLESLFSVLSSRVFYLALPIVLAFLFYWCIDKRKGEIILMSCIPAMVFTMTSKYGFNQPRPWDVDPKIIEVEGINANGQALPSGHTAMTVSSFIPVAAFFKSRVLESALLILAAMIIVGRLVLCAHTPLDIIAGLVVGLLAVLLSWKAIGYAYRDEGRYHVVNLVYSVFFTALFIVAIILWDVDAVVISGYAGFFYGMMVGRTLEHIYVGFEVGETCAREKILKFATGIIPGGALFLLSVALIPTFGTAVGGALMMLWCTFLYPLILQRRRNFM